MTLHRVFDFPRQQDMGARWRVPFRDGRTAGCTKTKQRIGSERANRAFSAAAGLLSRRWCEGCIRTFGRVPAGGTQS